jgi:hypothetical protein
MCSRALSVQAAAEHWLLSFVLFVLQFRWYICSTCSSVILRRVLAC